MRYFLEFSYFGKPYHGWQKQPNAVTVQQVLEEAISTLLRKNVELVGAGRTDAGVHARQMFAHFDTGGIEDLEDLSYRLNAFLPDAIAVRSVRQVSAEAHARFHAVERTYEYWVILKKNPFNTDFAHYVKHRLDIQRMNRAANILLQHEDFECFSKSNTDVKTYRCDIRKALWKNEDEKLVFTISADRFLRNMVRAIVGTLLEIGMQKWTVADLKAILNSKDRSQAGPSVPAKGLYLTSVRYPETIFEEYG